MATNKREINISKERRSKFLAKASISLIGQAPTVAAILSHDLLQARSPEENAASDCKRCTSCGEILISSYSATKKVKAKGTKEFQPDVKLAEPGKTMLDCNRCGATSSFKHIRRESKSSLCQQLSTSTPQHLTEKVLLTQSPQITHVSEQSTRVTKASSKKRTKSRKVGGLSEMLAQAKSRSTKPGLDLMDFMKGG